MKNQHHLLSLFLFFGLIVGPLVVAQEPECGRGRFTRLTDDWRFIASSARGAVGDVVGVDVALSAQNPRTDLAGFSMVLCYDDEALEPLGEPAYSEVFDRLVATEGQRLPPVVDLAEVAVRIEQAEEIEAVIPRDRRSVLIPEGSVGHVEGYREGVEAGDLNARIAEAGIRGDVEQSVTGQDTIATGAARKAVLANL